MRKIIFYRTHAGRSPVQDFVDSLSSKQAQKVSWVLRVVRDLERVPAEYFKKLAGTDALWEVRVQHGGDALRFPGFFDGARLVVLVSGFAKTTDKVPAREIALAQDRRKDYFKRKPYDG